MGLLLLAALASGQERELPEISPRWIAAGVTSVVFCSDQDDPATGTIRLELDGDARQYRVRLLPPAGVRNASATVGGRAVAPAAESMRDSRYVVLDKVAGLRPVILARNEPPDRK